MTKEKCPGAEAGHGENHHSKSTTTCHAGQVNSCLDAALHYESLGFYILPIIPGTKKPYVKWVHRADRRPSQDEIKSWFNEYPDAQIGTPTGLSGLTSLDFDNLGDMHRFKETVSDIGSPFSIATGRDGGGCHRLFKAVPDLQKKMVKVGGFDIDLLVHHQLEILPPSIHKSGRPYKWEGPDPLEMDPETFRDELPDLPSAAVAFLKGCAADDTRLNGDGQGPTLDPESILQGVDDGERDLTLFRYACRLRGKNLSLSEARTLVLQAAAASRPPFPEKEALVKLAQAFKYEPGTDADATINQWDDPLDMKPVIYEKPDTISWLVLERIPLGRGIIITGLGGSSKTRVLYILAIGCVVGFLPWTWTVERTGKAVLVLTEDTAQDVHRTVHYMARDLTDEQKQVLSENLIIYPLAGKDTRLMVKTGTGTVEKSPLFYSLQQKIIDLGGVVVVGLDPALSVSEGDELDQSHQRALGKMADDLAVTTGATVALVSHATKGSLSKQELTSHNSRGGGAITDAVRAEYSMRNMTIEEGNQAGITDVVERKRHVQLVATKGNAIPPSAFVPVWLRRDDFGNLAEADIEMDGKGTLTDRDMEVLKVHSKIGVFSTPSLADWRDECIKGGVITGDNPNAQKQAMKRVVDKLLKAGLIRKGVGRGIYTQTSEVTEPPF